MVSGIQLATNVHVYCRSRLESYIRYKKKRRTDNMYLNIKNRIDIRNHRQVHINRGPGLVLVGEPRVKGDGLLEEFFGNFLAHFAAEIFDIFQVLYVSINK